MDRFVTRIPRKVDDDNAPDPDEFFPILRKKRKYASKRGYSIEDLKRFSSKASDAGKKLAVWKESETSHLKSLREVDFEISEAKRMIDETETMFSSALAQWYPGERIIPIDPVRPANVKSSMDIVDDQKQRSIEEALFSAVAFASSTEELIQAKTALRRVLTSKSYRWTPTLDQFLGILSTAFGVDVGRLYEPLQADALFDRLSAYSRENFLSKTKPKKRRSIFDRDPESSSKSLENLEAILDALSWFKWSSTAMKGGDTTAWIGGLMSLALDETCRTRLAFQDSIATCIRGMTEAVAASKKEAYMKKFKEAIQMATIKNADGFRHHHDMVFLCSLLPSGRFSEMRSSIALECISVILDGEDDEEGSSNENGVISRLIILLEQAKEAKSGALRNAYPLSSILQLMQFVLTPTTVQAASAEEVDTLADILRAIAQKRFYGSDDDAKIEISLVDGSQLRCMINVILDGQLKSYRKNVDLFQFTSDEGGSERAASDNGEENGDGESAEEDTLDLGGH